MTEDLLPSIPMLLAWAAVLYLAPSRRPGPGDGSTQTFWLGLLVLALGLTLLVPSIGLTLDLLAGIANVSRLLAHGLVLGAAWAMQVYLLQLNYPDERGRWRIQRRVSALIGTLALLLMFFVLAPVHREASDFWGRYGGAPYILPYRLVFVGYLGWALVTVVRLCWRYAAITEHPATAFGLRVVTIGGVVSLVYCLHEALRVIASSLGITNAILDSNLLTEVLVAGGVGLMMVGCTMPAWGPRTRIPELVEWVRRYRAHRRLYPLWRDLYEVSPDIALFSRPGTLADVLTLRDLEFRLYRRVVEIRDGFLALRPYGDPEAAASALSRCRAVGLGDDTPLVVEAARLAVALDAKHQGRLGEAEAPVMSAIGGVDVPSEVLVLERFARCYARSPIVQTVRLEARRKHASVGPQPQGVGGT